MQTENRVPLTIHVNDTLVTKIERIAATAVPRSSKSAVAEMLILMGLVGYESASGGVAKKARTR